MFITDPEKMLPKVDSILADMFEKTATVVHDGTIWLQGQIPDVIQQFLKWKATEDIFFIVIGLLVGLSGFILYRVFWKLHKNAQSDDNNYYDGSWMFGVVLSSILGTIISLIIICPNLLDLLEILIAPKVYLLEYAANVYQMHAAQH